MSRTNTLVLVLFLVATSGCAKEPSEPARSTDHGTAEPARSTKSADASPATPAPHQDEAEEHQQLPTKVRLRPDVVRAAGIKTAPATMASLPVTVDLTGELAADPDRSAQLAARVPGRIVDVRVKEGQRVKAGQTVAILESPELARARATLASAAARMKVARLNADRLRRLESKSLASGQEASAAEAEAAALDAEAGAAKQTLSALGQGDDAATGGSARVTIRTPIAGFVLSRDAVQGQSVDAEHVIAVIGDLEHAYFLARLFEKDLARVKQGASAEVRLNAYPNEVFGGDVETVGKQLDPAARTVTARILVRNHGDLLKVGLFGTARVVAGTATVQRRHVVVPLSAITQLPEKNVVFVLQADGDFEVHPVTLGGSAAGRVEVLGGLREGERVVVDGVFTLKSAVLKGTFGEED
jgi:cobalt-zinc-cadmium efflux system membrane fusion protein